MALTGIQVINDTGHTADHNLIDIALAGGSGANTLGTFSNPIVDPNAVRPTGLTRVVFDTVTDPINWAIGDFNLQYGT